MKGVKKCLSCDLPSSDLIGVGICPACLLRPLATESVTPDSYLGEILSDRYHLTKIIGRGGMGIVYEAQQTEPISRKVAVKIIKPGMDSLVILNRFEAERQILALLDHPNIASILDGGITNKDHPYFVMDLAEGKSLLLYAHEQQLDLNEKLSLFLKVCSAIIHAHQRGIIHRDLKPSNILMSGSQPKVIDFGIAKSLQQKVSEETLHTLPGSLLGTPAYMAPEQLDSTTPIDIRTDIYGLGALLYEYLTSQPPFAPDRLQQATHTQLENIITNELPPRPSSINPQLPRDLDWIILKALEKSPARRYQTVNDLAADLNHFLSDETIIARPPSSGYRLKKFAKRNRAFLSVTTIIIASLLGATIISLNQAHQAKVARDEMQTVKNASEDLLEEVVEKLYPEARKTGNFAPLISSAKGIINYIDKVPQNQNLNPKTLTRRANGYYLAVKMLETASDFQTAQYAAEKNLHLRKEIHTQDPTDPWKRFHLGQAFNALGWIKLKLQNPATAARYFEKAASTHLINSKHPNPDVQWISNLQRAYRNHAVALTLLGDQKATRTAAEKSHTTAQNFSILFPDHPATPRILAEGTSSLLAILIETDPEAALPLAKQAIKNSLESAKRMGENTNIHGALAENRATLSQVLQKLGKHQEALVESQKTTQIWLNQLALEAKNANVRLLLADQLLHTATLHTKLNNPQQAHQTATQAKHHYQTLLNQNPNHPPALKGLAATQKIPQ